MKLSVIQKLSQKVRTPYTKLESDQIQQLLQQIGLDLSNIYQELEMDSPYVDTHMDISYSNSHLNLHSHSFYEIVCCRRASNTEYWVGSERYKLQPGDIIFVPPDVSHRPLLPEQVTDAYVRDVLWINPDFLNRVKQLSPELNLKTDEPKLFRTANSRWEYICDLFHNGVQENEQRNPGWEALVVANTITILMHMHRASMDMISHHLRAEKPELLDEILIYVENHLAEKITLADIAQHFYVSESTITQTFRKKVGISFYRCVTQRRLIAAKSLIEKGHSMESVSEQVGFSDYSSFFRAFKQEYGISPKQYKKLHSSMADQP